MWLCHCSYSNPNPKFPTLAEEHGRVRKERKKGVRAHVPKHPQPEVRAYNGYTLFHLGLNSVSRLSTPSDNILLYMGEHRCFHNSRPSDLQGWGAVHSMHDGGDQSPFYCKPRKQQPWPAVDPHVSWPSKQKAPDDGDEHWRIQRITSSRQWSN